MKILVTGAAGFIGFHVCSRLLQQGHTVYGVDNMNAYYDPQLKLDRLNILRHSEHFKFRELELAGDDFAISPEIGAVIHLAAQAGVRVDNGMDYIDNNIVAFYKVISEAKKGGCPLFIYASSSSVYGGEKSTSHPRSLYAATKKANEVMAYSMSDKNFVTVGLRFYNVYGDWGRPDSAIFKFTKAIIEGTPIQLYGTQKMARDFTHVSDVVSHVFAFAREPLDWVENSDFGSVWDIGNGIPTKITELVSMLERIIGKKAIIERVPADPRDIERSYAGDDALCGVMPLEPGLRHFVAWYMEYYKLELKV